MRLSASRLTLSAGLSSEGLMHADSSYTAGVCTLTVSQCHDGRVDAEKELAECSECSSQLMSVVLCGREGVWERREGAFQATRYGNMVAL